MNAGIQGFVAVSSSIDWTNNNNSDNTSDHYKINNVKKRAQVAEAQLFRRRTCKR